MTLYKPTYYGEDDDWPVPIPDGWIYGGTADEFGLIEQWMVPIDVEELLFDIAECVITASYGMGCDFDYDEARKLLTEGDQNG